MARAWAWSGHKYLGVKLGLGLGLKKASFALSQGDAEEAFDFDSNDIFQSRSFDISISCFSNF